MELKWSCFNGKNCGDLKEIDLSTLISRRRLRTLEGVTRLIGTLIYTLMLYLLSENEHVNSSNTNTVNSYSTIDGFREVRLTCIFEKCFFLSEEYGGRESRDILSAYGRATVNRLDNHSSSAHHDHTVWFLDISVSDSFYL